MLNRFPLDPDQEDLSLAPPIAIVTNSRLQDFVRAIGGETPTVFSGKFGDREKEILADDFLTFDSVDQLPFGGTYEIRQENGIQISPEKFVAPNAYKEKLWLIKSLTYKGPRSNLENVVRNLVPLVTYHVTEDPNVAYHAQTNTE